VEDIFLALLGVDYQNISWIVKELYNVGVFIELARISPEEDGHEIECPLGDSMCVPMSQIVAGKELYCKFCTFKTAEGYAPLMSAEKLPLVVALLPELAACSDEICTIICCLREECCVIVY
jgi:hypothetical protein